ncbi:MAG: thermonuclease family protein [Thermoprotei archaeon]|nr:thermonuclease family protein [Thermoprotei archaeon]
MRGYSLHAVSIVLFMIVLLVSAQAFAAHAFEALVEVTRVIDGDTFEAYVLKVYKGEFSDFKGKSVKIRMADINAPELGTVEGETSKIFLSNLLQKAQVYIDIDDLYVYDKYKRVVAVVYKPENSTHAININMLLANKGMADIVDYKNEFNPQKWQLYVKIPEHIKEDSTELKPDHEVWKIVIIASIAILAIIIIIIAGRIKK